ncbi:MAG: anhydro-N-acetylmuramic acid kinase [Polyangiaceae bacterium]
MIAIGIMSGTSCDGVDAVALRLRSVAEPHEPELLGHAFEPFSAELSRELLKPDEISVRRLAELHYLLPEIYSKAVKRLPGAESASVCGMHGQTIWHQPPSRLPGSDSVPCTLQIGSSAVLASRLGVPVVGDFRGADIARGGEGAPLVPLSHWFFTPRERRPRVVVNFGGIANISVVNDDPAKVMGFDVGAGMMLSDAHARLATSGKQGCDLDGKLSASGKVIPEMLEEILGHPFLARKPPKSTGREDFGAAYCATALNKYSDRPTEDVAHTLLAATAEGLARAIEQFAGGAVREVLLTGGGAKNPTLVGLVKRRLPGSRVETTHDGVLSASCHEPSAMALFAARTLAGLTSSIPEVTGAREAARLGHIHWP